MNIEEELKRYNRIKTDLLKMAKYIDVCANKSEEEFYQNICLEYSKELKKVKKCIESTHDVKICECGIE